MIEPMLLDLPPVAPVESGLAAAVRAKLDGKAKPPGSLGRLEDLASQLALIRGEAAPTLDRAALLIFAGDHGLTEEGVSSYPAEVTVAMVRTLLAGGATANAFARSVGAEITVCDVGVRAELDPHPFLVSEKIRGGTRNAARESALTAGEVRRALSVGARLAGRAVAAGADVVALGEMGIGNTASASLLMHRLLPAPLEDCVGRGAGHDAAGMARKRDALARAAGRSAATDPFAVLCEFGGLEIAALAGAAIGTAAARRPVIVDGFITSAAVLAAIRLQPRVAGYCVFAHRSAERGHARMLDELGADPLLDLGLRLGEGTGALLAVPLLRAAARILSDVASLDDVLSGAA